jgi:hypothetical protein
MGELFFCLGIVPIFGVAWFGAILTIDPHRREKGSTKNLVFSFTLRIRGIPLAILLYRFIKLGTYF